MNVLTITLTGAREWLSNMSATELTFALRLTERFKEMILEDTSTEEDL